MSIAKTIHQQIKALDFWALGAWAARELTDCGDGLRFKVNCPKLKHGFVKITLNGSDLYDIRFMKMRSGKFIVDETINDVFVENLVEVIDRRVG